jgi:hypothetical protein
MIDWLIGWLTNYTKQKPSWKTDRFPASQEIPRILWNQTVHYLIHKSQPPVPILSCQRNSPSVRPCEMFLNIVSSYGADLLANRPNLKLKGHPKSAVRDCSVCSQLPSIFQALPPTATWGRAMPWWQEPTYHGPVSSSASRNSVDPRRWNLIDRSMTAPPLPLSLNSILPPPSSHCTFQYCMGKFGAPFENIISIRLPFNIWVRAVMSNSENFCTNYQLTNWDIWW